jgi:segregation and condensation protein B
MSHRPELEAAVEAILFVTPDPVPAERLLAAFDESERDDARSALEAVIARYAADESRGVRLEEVAGGFRIVTAAECHPYLRRFFDAAGANRLSMAALETLAIVAYRQPVTRPEIEEIRGVDCGAVVKALLERRLVRILGKKEEPGRPILYGTTREFLEFFSLKDLASLPTLREFHELSQEHREIVEKAPEPEPEPIAGLLDELRDEQVEAELAAKRAEGDAALDELERAIDAADEKSRTAEAALGEKKEKEEVEPPPPPGDAEGSG